MCPLCRATLSAKTVGAHCTQVTRQHSPLPSGLTGRPTPRTSRESLSTKGHVLAQPARPTACPQSRQGPCRGRITGQQATQSDRWQGTGGTHV
jgi:hypothetical protein